MSNLENHAEEEMRRAGLYDRDSEAHSCRVSGHGG